ncbi:MAG TPA: cell division protein FtsA [Rickettsiales bacterium]|nr:cell division protein FtsA [Rickettsiales bacterium]
MALKQQRIIASLDIGSNKIVCLVGYINTMGKVCVRGIGHQQARGIQCGKIINKKEAEKNILSTISIAEKIAGYNIQDIAISISSSEITSSTINTDIKLNGKEVKDKDINNLLKDIKNILKKEGKEVVHLMPLQYCLDDTVVESPYSMQAENLKITFHLLTSQKSTLNKIKDCIKSMMLDISNYVSTVYASSLSVLSETEKELGALVLDIGSNGTNIGLVYDNKYVFEGNICIAGDTITKDISNILKITQGTAEKIKVINTNFSLSENEENELIKIKIDTDEDFEASKNKVSLINDIAKARIEEIVQIAMQKLKDCDLQNVPQYIVLTGGTALIPNIDNFVSNITDLETRIGYNDNNFTIQDRNLAVELRNPIYSVAMGTLKFIQNKYNSINQVENESTFFNILKKLFS